MPPCKNWRKQLPQPTTQESRQNPKAEATPQTQLVDPLAFDFSHKKFLSLINPLPLSYLPCRLSYCWRWVHFAWQPISLKWKFMFFTRNSSSVTNIPIPHHYSYYLIPVLARA